MRLPKKAVYPVTSLPEEGGTAYSNSKVDTARIATEGDGPTFLRLLHSLFSPLLRFV